MIAEATRIITEAEGAPPAGWLSPYLMPSANTPELIMEAGYTYLLDWGLCDDQPFWSSTKAGPLLAVPYTVELNDQPAMVYRRDRPRDFAEMSIDHLDEHIRGSSRYSTVCVISLHSFIVGQPFRLAHLRRTVFAQMFNVPIADEQACVFVEPGVIDQLQSMTAPAVN